MQERLDIPGRHKNNTNERNQVKYRQYGKNGPEVSVLGYGVMRLPGRRKHDWGSVNFTKSFQVMRAAMESGVNFFDSHHMYHHGLSEVAIGRALKGWKGQRIYLQTKAPFYNEEPVDYFKKLLEEALEKMGVDCIDYLLFHSMKLETFQKRHKKFVKFTDWAMKKGYILNRGFSSHDSPENVRTFIDTGDFSAMLVSYNWLNPKMADVIAYAADKGMGVSVMNPVSGGSLATNTLQILRMIRGARSAPEIALRYAMSTPGVTAAFSGMNTLGQVEENVRTASRPIIMTAKQWKYMQDRLSKFQESSQELCTTCGYCMPCPHGVHIPGNFLALIQAKLLGLERLSRMRFQRLMKNKDGDMSAMACKQCGVCLEKCPNEIQIIDQLAETAKTLS